MFRKRGNGCLLLFTRGMGSATKKLKQGGGTVLSLEATKLTCIQLSISCLGGRIIIVIVHVEFDALRG